MSKPLSATILGTRVDATDYLEACRQILAWARAGESRFVCAANVHTLMEARDLEGFRQVLNEADLVTPDGMPLVWMMRIKGQGGQQRVYGPTLMLKIIEAAAANGVRVGFYGGRPEVLNGLIRRMRARHNNLSVVYSFSPPFRELSSQEDAQVCETIHSAGAQILFVGLGCPKQEQWMAGHKGRVPAVMLGVGAAFDFHAGVKPQAPDWIQNAGLEWAFRLSTEPRRLWKRYFLHNPRFAVLALAELLGWGKP